MRNCLQSIILLNYKALTLYMHHGVLFFVTQHDRPSRCSSGDWSAPSKQVEFGLPRYFTIINTVLTISSHSIVLNICLYFIVCYLIQPCARV